MEYDKWDIMVLKYRTSKSQKEKNTIYKELRQLYLPKLYSNMKRYPYKYHDDMKSLYDIYFLKAMERWEGINNCHFSSYVYTWINLKLKSELHEKYIKKDNKHCSLDEYEEYEKAKH